MQEDKYKKLIEIIKSEEDLFMEAVMGGRFHEDGERYATIFRYEWHACIHEFVYEAYKNYLEKLFGENLAATSMVAYMGYFAAGFADVEDEFDYVLLLEWCLDVTDEYNKWLEKVNQ